MRILCTCPGRHGDILWALPTVRAISDHYRQPIDLLIAGEFGGLLPLLHLQPYLGTVTADDRWNAHDPTPSETIVADASPEEREAIIHLGYQRGWPQLPLPYEIEWTANARGGICVAIDLERPWITVDADPHWPRIVSGWSDCHFELKVGILDLLASKDMMIDVVPGPGRWVTEGGWTACTWVEAAQAIAQAQLFVGDCSALHVLAVAIGTPVLLVEPMEARWNPIFYPLGKDGPQVKLIRGLDGNPTFDARHVTEAMKETLDGDQSTRSQTV